MNDETADIPTPLPGEASPQPDADRAPVAARKKRGKSAAKAATEAIEARVGHKFSDPALLMTAFTHVSALKLARKRGDSYQRLEFLGDHVLGLVVSDHRILRRIGPLEGQGTSAGTGRGRRSAGPPLALRCTAGPSLSEFVVVPVRHTHPL